MQWKGIYTYILTFPRSVSMCSISVKSGIVTWLMFCSSIFNCLYLLDYIFQQASLLRWHGMEKGMNERMPYKTIEIWYAAEIYSEVKCNLCLKLKVLPSFNKRRIVIKPTVLPERLYYISSYLSIYYILSLSLSIHLDDNEIQR